MLVLRLASPPLNGALINFTKLARFFSAQGWIAIDVVELAARDE